MNEKQAELPPLLEGGVDAMTLNSTQRKRSWRTKMEEGCVNFHVPMFLLEVVAFSEGGQKRLLDW